MKTAYASAGRNILYIYLTKHRHVIDIKVALRF